MNKVTALLIFFTTALTPSLTWACGQAMLPTAAEKPAKYAWIPGAMDVLAMSLFGLLLAFCILYLCFGLSGSLTEVDARKNNVRLVQGFLAVVIFVLPCLSFGSLGVQNNHAGVVPGIVVSFISMIFLGAAQFHKPWRADEPKRRGIILGSIVGLTLGILLSAATLLLSVPYEAPPSHFNQDVTQEVNFN